LACYRKTRGPTIGLTARILCARAQHHASALADGRSIAHQLREQSQISQTGDPLTIVSIVHKSATLKKTYALFALSQIWQSQGIDVRVGRTFDPDASLGFLHLDQTRIKPQHIPDVPPGLRIVNHRVLDISKRNISSLLLTPDSDWDGPIIIKTDLNSFGNPERRGKKVGWRDWATAKAAQVSWRHAGRLPKMTYPVLTGLKRVPGWVWRDPGLVVERFLPEREGDFYCLRGWMFLGNRGYGWRLFSTDPMVKINTMVKYEYIDEPPAVLHQFREQRNFDYGKFDYVMHDGVAILLDANKTPAFSGEANSPRINEIAKGLMDFLP
jgi:hypothetical protein